MLRCVSVAPLGKPVVPLVYWMLMGSSGASPSARARSSLRRDLAGAGQKLVPVGRVHKHHPLELGERGADLFDHRPVVRGLERRGGHEHAAAGLAQDVLELRGPVGRVDVDQNGAELGGGVLDQRPLHAVGAPDPDPVRLLEPGGDQRARQLVHGRTQLGVAVAATLGAGDERIALAEARHSAVQVGADRLVEQGHGRVAARVGIAHRLLRWLTENPGRDSTAAREGHTQGAVPPAPLLP